MIETVGCKIHFITVDLLLLANVNRGPACLIWNCIELLSSCYLCLREILHRVSRLSCLVIVMADLLLLLVRYGLGLVPLFLVRGLNTKPIIMRFRTHIESCDGLTLCAGLRRSLANHLTTRSVWSLFVRALLEDKRRTIRRNSVEFLLFRNENLGLGLHWER